MRGEDSEAVSRVRIKPRDKRPVYRYECLASTPGINLTLSHTKSISLHCEYFTPDFYMKIDGKISC